MKKVGSYIKKYDEVVFLVSETNKMSYVVRRASELSKRQLNLAVLFASMRNGMRYLVIK